MKAKTTTLVLAYGDGALIIGGSYLLLKLEGTSSNYVSAQVKVSGGFQYKKTPKTINQTKNKKKEENDKHGGGKSRFTTAKKR